MNAIHRIFEFYIFTMTNFDISVLLADDDIDDCYLFEDALSELPGMTKLTTANDGIELMDMLDKTVPPPPISSSLTLTCPVKTGLNAWKN